MQIVGVPLAIAAVGLGVKQISKAVKTARVQVLLALDESLSGFEDIRAELNSATPTFTTHDEKVRLRRYIGAFERVGYVLRERQTTLDVVNQFYGHRFANLANYMNANNYAKNIVQMRRGGRTSFTCGESCKESENCRIHRATKSIRSSKSGHRG